MNELLAGLRPGAKVLDLGAGDDSFKHVRHDLMVIRLDLVPPRRPKVMHYVVADAARLPFTSHSIDAVISNHSLEHIADLDAAIREIGRIIKRDGALYVAVPDSTTLTDRIYQWLGRGGGHVNPFPSAESVRTLVEKNTGLPHRQTRVLFTSLAFLNAHNFVTRPPRKIALFGFGHERFLTALNVLLRLFDRLTGTRLSIYGWTFYFGNVENLPETEPLVNVCVRCGSGHEREFLVASGAVIRRKWLADSYRCPSCGVINVFFKTTPRAASRVK